MQFQLVLTDEGNLIAGQEPRGHFRWMEKSEGKMVLQEFGSKECQHTLPSNPALLNYSEPLQTSNNLPMYWYLTHQAACYSGKD